MSIQGARFKAYRLIQDFNFFQGESNGYIWKYRFKFILGWKFKAIDQGQCSGFSTRLLGSIQTINLV